jgi:hypothetical protein
MGWGIPRHATAMSTSCTEIIGTFDISPRLNPAESEYLIAFSETRRWWRKDGSYTVPPNPRIPEEFDDPVLYSTPSPGVPDLCCGWIPTPGGQALSFSGNPEFGRPAAWLRYLIKHFLRPGAQASSSGDPAFKEFTFDHVVNGTAAARSPETGRLWLITATDSVVRERVLVPGEPMLGGEEIWQPASIPGTARRA